ncbi:MAG: choice-of-anchor P family protein, partial [Candidatus Polarisedimenticolia bacterium]
MRRIHAMTSTCLRWLPALALLLPGLLSGAPAQADTFGGRAYAAYVSVPTLGVAPVTLADSGELPPGGGWDGAGLAGAAYPGVFQASVLNSVTSGGSGRAGSTASLADLALLPGHPARLTASFVMAEAAATGAGATGVTRVDGLSFGGVPVRVTGAPNQTVSLPLVATLFINEQRVTSIGGVQAVAVNALRLVLVTGEQVILAGARSQVDPAGTAVAAARRGAAGRCDA